MLQLKLRCDKTWWRHQMETFSALLAICAVNSPVTGEFTAQRPVTRSFDVFFDLRLNKRLNKQSWGKWFETLSRLLWRHCNEESWSDTSWVVRGVCQEYGHNRKTAFINPDVYGCVSHVDHHWDSGYICLPRATGILSTTVVAPKAFPINVQINHLSLTGRS